MSGQIKYRIASGEPTAKWKASAATGAGVGVPLAIVVGYVVARVDPQMDGVVREAMVGLVVWAITQGSMMAAGWLARPSPDDAPVVDPATVPRPPSGIP